jgi:hypothetical protein
MGATGVARVNAAVVATGAGVGAGADGVERGTTVGDDPTGTPVGTGVSGFEGRALEIRPRAPHAVTAMVTAALAERRKKSDRRSFAVEATGPTPR